MVNESLHWHWMTRPDTTPTCFEVGCGVYPAYRTVSVLLPLHRHLMDKIVMAAHHTAPCSLCLSRDCMQCHCICTGTDRAATRWTGAAAMQPPPKHPVALHRPVSCALRGAEAPARSSLYGRGAAAQWWFGAIAHSTAADSGGRARPLPSAFPPSVINNYVPLPRPTSLPTYIPLPLSPDPHNAPDPPWTLFSHLTSPDMARLAIVALLAFFLAAAAAQHPPADFEFVMRFMGSCKFSDKSYFCQGKGTSEVGCVQSSSTYSRAVTDTTSLFSRTTPTLPVLGTARTAHGGADRPGPRRPLRGSPHAWTSGPVERDWHHGRQRRL